ncbi:unnamed protein product [Paramecium octaurelia]|uniref:Uncharacterized protein n=1 Tax=Paramecium octaurelia TaxID=43137 RepID=A0A8S1TSG7_PAROT|nr:unnamed protein product [Paramecium octaurelia]
MVVYWKFFKVFDKLNCPIVVIYWIHLFLNFEIHLFKSQFITTI